MSEWQTVNEALDLILDVRPGEDENKEPAGVGGGGWGGEGSEIWIYVRALQ